MDTVQQLRDLGLLVLYSERAGRPRYFIYEDYTIHNEGEDSPFPVRGIKARTRLMIAPEENLWYFNRHDYTPGPGPDDFVASYASENEALIAALEYFTGEPTVIEGWPIPLHRFPQIGQEQARKAIQSAQNITASEFKVITKDYGSQWLKMFPKGNPYQYIFLAVPHQTNEQLVLYLRRDGQEAFVVEKG